MKVSVIVPAYNEENALKDVCDDLKKLVFDDDIEIIVVDDGSSDGTYEIGKSIDGIKLFRHETNKGKAAALETGFDNASGDVYVTIDADCTYPIDNIHELVDEVKKGFDLVIASRFLGRIDEMPKLNYYGNLVFSQMISLLTGQKITDGSTGMRALTRSLWDNMTVKSKGLDWEVEMTTRSIHQGFRVKELPITYSDRVGVSKLNPLVDGFRFFVAILKGRFF